MTTVRESHRALRDSCSAYAVFMRLSRIRAATEARRSHLRTRDGLASAIDRRIISRFFLRGYNPQITLRTRRYANRKKMVIGPQPELPTAVAIASRLTVHLAGLIIRLKSATTRGRITPSPTPGGGAFRSICHANAQAKRVTRQREIPVIQACETA